MSLIGSDHCRAELRCVQSHLSAPQTRVGLSRISSDILFRFGCEILLAAAVGGSLATAGAGYQSLLRNPLAETYLLGISNGAALGTMNRTRLFRGKRMDASF